MSIIDFLLIPEKLERIEMKVSDLKVAVETIGTQLEKAKTEIVTKITALETALANTDIPDDAVAALDALKTSAQSLDDVVPDPEPTV